MGLFFESELEREARLAAKRDIVRHKKRRHLDRYEDKQARKAAVSRWGWGLWQGEG